MDKMNYWYKDETQKSYVKQKEIDTIQYEVYVYGVLEKSYMSY